MRFSWIILGGLDYHKGHHKEEDVRMEAGTKSREDALLLALTVEEEAASQGMQVALEARHGEETDSPLGFPEVTQPCSYILDF